MNYHAYGFVDGAYLRARAKAAGTTLVNPHSLLVNVVYKPIVQQWCASRVSKGEIVLARVSYYDGIPDDQSQASENLLSYWSEVELLEDTELGFGSVREGTKKKAKKQKGVDSLIAVDMLVGAFNQLFPVAILVAGDSDFVPVVNEVRRRGVMVVVAAEKSSLADDLRRAADRVVFIGPSESHSGLFPLLQKDGKSWPAE